MKLHASLLPLLASIVMIATGGSTATPFTATHSILATRSMGAPFVGPANCTNCTGCLFQGSTVHKSVFVEAGPYQGAHSCLETGSSGCAHPACGASAQLTEGDYQELSRLTELVRRGDSPALVAMLRQFPEKVHFIPSRHALQIEGCDDATIATHLPLPESLVKAAEDGRAPEAFGE